MKTNAFIIYLIKTHPYLILLNILLILFSSFFIMSTALTIAPLVNIIAHGGLGDKGDIVTNSAKHFFPFIGLPFNLYTVGIFFVLQNAIVALFQIAIQRIILVTKYQVVRDTMLKTFEAFFNAKWFFFSSTNQGMLINTFIRESSQIGDAFGAIARLFASITQILIVMILPFVLSWQLTFFCIIIGILFNFPILLLSKYSRKLGQMNVATSNCFSGGIQESLSMAKVILGFGNNNEQIKTLNTKYYNHVKATLKSQTFDVIITNLSGSLSTLIAVLTLFLGFIVGLPLAKLGVVVYTLKLLIPIFSVITKGKLNIDKFFPSYEQIENLKNKAVNLKQITGGKKFDCINVGISIENLTFSYSTNNSPVLKKLNLTIPKGKMIAIVGESGAGKSTLIDFLLGFNTPDEGCIYIDNIPLSVYDVNTYRKKIGYVPQDSVLFDMSVENNIYWANKNATFEEVKNACIVANADSFIEKCPEGYKTIVGDRGVRLSGGQAQRISLARAIVRKPNLLILDEATSSLDSRSELLIQTALDNISKTTTTVIVAHRLSTIKNADIIYVLNNGTIAEKGNYDYLMKQNGLFRKMVQTQNFSE
jgi:ABC-type multidrug transport system fused ATPase/permease subunit